MGKVYFDKGLRRIVYKAHFPQPETLVISDSVVQKVGADTTISSPASPGIIDFSLFNLILSDELADYGLGDSLYSRASVERVDDMVITTWKPDPVLQGLTGDVQIARKGKLLHAVVFYSANGEVLGRQFFRKYEVSEGLPFPAEIIQVMKKDDVENYIITTFSNIRFNEADTEGHYTTPLAK